MTPEPNEESGTDPLIDEVRGIRRAISNLYDNDIDRLYEHLREVQRQYAGRIVSRKRSRGVARILKSNRSA